MSKSTIHRNSSSLHIERIHKKQLMREVQEQSKQPSSLQISRMLSKEIEKRLQVNQCVRDVMLKSCKKIKDDYNMSRFKTTHHAKQNRPADRHFSKQPEGLKKIQNKIIKIKEHMNRVLPSEYGLSKVQRKINQIIYIKNEGHRLKDEQFICSRVLHSKDKKQQIIFGDNEVINRYWNQLSREAKVSKQSLLMIKENRVNMLIRQNLGPDQDMSQIDQIKAKLNRKVAQGVQDIRKSADYLNKTTFLKLKKTRHNKYSSLDASTLEIQPQETKKQGPTEPIKYGLTKEILQNSFIQYLKQKKQRKLFLNRLNKDLIDGEDVIKIYSFVKGGYDLDPYDLQGQFISLRRFNQAKQSFYTLKELYKAIKTDCFYGRTSQKSGNRSFKSIVYVNELSGKMAPNQLLKIMKQKKIVK